MRDVLPLTDEITNASRPSCGEENRAQQLASQGACSSRRSAMEKRHPCERPASSAPLVSVGIVESLRTSAQNAVSN